MSFENYESENVHKFYSLQADKFSETRFKPWPRTEQFLDSIVNDNHLILDAGCGNGRNSKVRNTFCLDYSEELLKIGQKLRKDTKQNFIRSDVIFMPFKDATFNIVLSIAVIHHIASTGRRLAAIQEMRRVLKIGGQLLIYVWSSKFSHKQKFKSIDSNPNMDPKKDFHALWANNPLEKRYYHLFSHSEFRQLIQDGGFDIMEIGEEQESLYILAKPSSTSKN